jgi:ABC-type antimicrobial peptide transport system permease subunit
MNQRRREIGIRLALGAQPALMVARLLCNTGLVVGAALAAGLGASWALSRTIESFLFEVNPRNPLLYGGVASVIAVVAAAAAWLPARSAATVDPLTVLRAE